MDLAKTLSVAAAASRRLAKDTAVLLRQSVWWILLALAVFSVLGLFFRFWLGLVFLFPLVVAYVTLAPLLCLARPWRHAVDSGLVADAPGDTTATAGAIVAWFLPRVLVLLLVWLGFLAIVSLLWDVNLLTRGRLVCFDSWRGWSLCPLDIAVELGGVSYNDLSSVWCDFRLDGAVFYFLTNAFYCAALIAFLWSRKRSSYRVITCLYLAATVVMDNAFYGFEYLHEGWWRRVIGIAMDPVYDISKAWVLGSYVSAWLSQTFLVWWYVLLKWCLTVLLVHLLAKSMGRTSSTTSGTSLPE